MTSVTFVNPFAIPDFVREAEERMARGKDLLPEELVPECKEVTIKFGRGLVGKPYTSKTGKELVEVRVPNMNPADKRFWESFLIESSMVHDNKFGKGVWMKLPENGKIQLSRSAKVGVDEIGKSIWTRESRTVTGGELKNMLETYKSRSRGMER